MLISEKVTIDAPQDIVWGHLRTLQGAEQYLPVVIKSEVKGEGLGTTRTCDIQMGEQSFQISETLVKLDDVEKLLSISIDSAPPPMKDLKIDFSVTGNNNSSEVQVSTEAELPKEEVKMIEGIVSMICGGLKQFHEK
jgi:carbon monoxide dehydrogenase subunit G